MLKVEVCTPESVPDLGPADRWTFSGGALAPQRLRLSARDRRWETLWTVARRGDDVVGVLPLYRSRNTAMAESIFDPTVVAPGTVAPADATGWLYVGGMRDLISGTTVLSSEGDEVRRALVASAFAHSPHPVALFVRDAEIQAFRDVLGERARIVVCKSDATVELPLVLSSKQRGVINSDVRKLAELGIAAEIVDPAPIIAESASLVVASKQRYGVTDLELMVRMRLKEWLNGGAREYRAVTLRNEQGELVGVTYLAVFGDSAELNEGALAADIPHRHLRYVEMLFHGPLRYAMSLGCQRLVLGPDSIAPKAWRGATIRPIWTVTL